MKIKSRDAERTQPLGLPCGTFTISDVRDRLQVVHAAMDAIVWRIRRGGFDGTQEVHPSNALRIFLKDVHGSLLDLLTVQSHGCLLSRIA